MWLPIASHIRVLWHLSVLLWDCPLKICICFRVIVLFNIANPFQSQVDLLFYFITPFQRSWNGVIPSGSVDVLHEMYATTAQNIQTALVGVNHNCSKHSYICMLTRILSSIHFHPKYGCTANRRLNLEAPIFPSVFNPYSCLQNTFTFHFISKSSTSLTFIFKVKDSNRIHWQVHNVWNQREMRSSHYRHDGRYQSPQCQGVSEFEMDLTFAKICQVVLAYGQIFKRNEMHCILAYVIRRSVCPCVSVCVSVCMSFWTLLWLTTQKRIEIYPSFF